MDFETVDGTLFDGAPDGPIETRWDRHRFDLKVVNPANKRKYKVIVVGTGLAGGAAAASLAELGYDVLNFCIQDTPRRAHSVAAQGGINAARITRTTATRSGACFTTRSRAATSAPASRMSTALPSARRTSSTSASHRAFRSHVNTAARSPTARLAAPRSRARSTHAARPGSSFCWAPMAR